MKVFRKIGRIVTAPARLARKGVDAGVQKGQQMATRLIVLAVLRTVIKAAGFAGVFSDAYVNEIAGWLMVGGTLLWTGFNTWREIRAAKAAE